ncbi:MAG TPA: hypothetical protein VFR76_05035 [Verrucomicrobiae bacterium]|nr:hypothetical protein [Verrucomicrobiae bacterium]
MPDPTTTPPPRKGRGCLFYGCLTCVVLLLIMAVLAVVAIRFVKNQVNAYTDSQPMKLPRVEMTDAEFQQLDQRVKAFGDAMEKGKPAEPLILAERDINALIVKAANLKELADKVYVSVNGNEVKGQVSIPLSRLGWLGKGRYLNGEATFNVSLENGMLMVTAREIKVKGKPLPESFMSQLRHENLAKEASKDPKNAEAIRKLDSIQVQESQVLIKARGAP